MDADVEQRVLAALDGAGEPLSPGAIQRRIAADGLDVATGAIREACRRLADAGEVEAVGDPPRRRYRRPD